MVMTMQVDTETVNAVLIGNLPEWTEIRTGSLVLNGDSRSGGGWFFCTDPTDRKITGRIDQLHALRHAQPTP